MNKVVEVGRLTRDPDIKYTSGENATAIARFSVAVNRRFKNSEGKYDADFINCVSFGKTGEFIEKYFHKGDMIGIAGRIQTGSYVNKEGTKVYTTDVVAEEAYFVGGKSSNNNDSAAKSTGKPDDEFMSIPEDEDSELPFN